MDNENFIDYDTLLKESMFYVIKEVLKKVAKHGLCGDHYFYISYDTSYKGVKMPPSLKKRYPDEVTIVIQHNFKDLVVFDKYFQVSLSFNGRYVKLAIPFDAINSFSDPSEMFKLEPKDDFDYSIYNRKHILDMEQERGVEYPPGYSTSNHMVSSGNVIYLDAFRQSRKTPLSFEDDE